MAVILNHDSIATPFTNHTVVSKKLDPKREQFLPTDKFDILV